MERTPRIYGALPRVVANIDLSPKEMMFWMYCPVKVPGTHRMVIPENLKQYHPMLMMVMEDCRERSFDSYMYITAKTLYTTPENPGNRPGWHSDGFLTDDLNYVWSDTNPTVFYFDGQMHSFSRDHQISIPEMDFLCEDEEFWVKYPDKTLLRLDERVLHKVNTDIEAGLRTFVKVSVSYNQYALEGNSINHELGAFDMKPRSLSRNCPIEGEG